MSVLPATTHIGHTHLRVSDLERSLAFYCRALGFAVTYREDEMVFLAAGAYHHHIAINIATTKGAPPPPAGHTGLEHHAIVLPDRRSLVEAVRRLTAAGWPPCATVHHGVSDACYFTDPDGIGVELYVEEPRESWPRKADGTLAVHSTPMDLSELERPFAD